MLMVGNENVSAVTWSSAKSNSIDTKEVVEDAERVIDEVLGEGAMSMGEAVENERVGEAADSDSESERLAT